LFLALSTGNAFASGCAYAKAVFELAQKELSGGLKVSKARLLTVPSVLAAAQHKRPQEVLDHGAFLAERTLPSCRNACRDTIKRGAHYSNN
jgi:hypothetical protein